MGKAGLAGEPAFSSSPSSLGPHLWPPPSRLARPRLFPRRQQPPPAAPPAWGRWGELTVPASQTLFTISFTEPGAPWAPPSLPTAQDQRRLLRGTADAPSSPAWTHLFPLGQYICTETCPGFSYIKTVFPSPPAPGSVLLP